MIWDGYIRLFHWSLAASFLANYWWLEDGDTAHEWTGYFILALLSSRILWGFIGSPTARFSHFFPTPKRLHMGVTEFGRFYTPHKGHSPLGGLMVIFLITMILVTGISGWMQELDRFWGEDWVQQLHEWSAHIVMAAVVVHVAAVFIIQRRYQVPLIRAMIKGK